MSRISKGLLEVEGRQAQMVEDTFGENMLWEYKPGRLILFEKFHQIADKILDADIRKDDVWVISYPRTGSNWIQEMVWLVANDLDFHKAKSSAQYLRAPIIEASAYSGQVKNASAKFSELYSVEICNNFPSPRCVKSHLTYEFLPRKIHNVKPKIIYTARNAKDVCVSYYHYLQKVTNKNILFEDFVEMFLSGNVPIGNVFDHYLPYWRHRDEMNLLYLKYEDSVRNPKECVKRLAEFMEKPLENKQIDNICDFLTVENMRSNPELLTSPNIVRKGIVGDWKNYMDDELSLRFNEFIEKHLNGTGLTFDE